MRTSWRRCAFSLGVLAILAAPTTVLCDRQWVVVDLGYFNTGKFKPPTPDFDFSSLQPFTHACISENGQVAGAATVRFNSEWLSYWLGVWTPDPQSMLGLGQVAVGGIIYNGLTEDGPTESEGLAVNASGHAVGWSHYYRGTSARRGVFWNETGLHDMGAVSVNAIDNSGNMAGTGKWVSSPSAAFPRAMRILAGTGSEQRLDMRTGDHNSHGYAINSAGAVAGEDDYRAAIWTAPGVSATIDSFQYSTALDINESGAACGYEGVYISNTAPVNGFLWTSEAGIQLIGSLAGSGGRSSALSLNNNNQIAGWSYTEEGDGNYTGPIHAIVWKDGVMEDLGTLAGERSWAHLITDDERVFGFSEDNFPNGTSERVVRWERESTIDGNGDSTPDDQQTNVISFPTASGRTVTLVAPDGTTIRQVRCHLGPAQFAFASAELYFLDFPLRFISFVVDGVPTGGTTSVECIVQDPAPTMNAVWALEFDSQTGAAQYYLFAPEGQTGASFSKDAQDRLHIALDLQDGGRGDDDETANGSIHFQFGASGGSIDLGKIRLNIIAGLPLTGPETEEYDLNDDGIIDISDLWMHVPLIPAR
ncbi:hypothetical protein KQI84_18475 [bacterium]|nr:hypothetical protein [bacterium]